MNTQPPPPPPNEAQDDEDLEVSVESDSSEFGDMTRAWMAGGSEIGELESALAAEKKRMVIVYVTALLALGGIITAVIFM